MVRPLGKIGVYSDKTTALRRKLTFELYGLTMKTCLVHRYLGSAVNDTPDINDIQSVAFMEVPDRSYDAQTIELPIGMERFTNSVTDFTRFGIINPMGDEHSFSFHVDDFDALGRWLIPGDIFELPFYSDPDNKSMWEVTDVDDKTVKEDFIVSVKASIMGKSRKTRDIPVATMEDSLGVLMLDEIEETSESLVPSIEPTWDENPTVTDNDTRIPETRNVLDDPDFEI